MACELQIQRSKANPPSPDCSLEWGPHGGGQLESVAEGALPMLTSKARNLNVAKDQVQFHRYGTITNPCIVGTKWRPPRERAQL